MILKCVEEKNYKALSSSKMFLSVINFVTSPLGLINIKDLLHDSERSVLETGPFNK